VLRSECDIVQYTRMKVADVMNTKVCTVTPETTYGDAVQVMQTQSCSAVPVVDVRGDLVGILSDKDLFRAIYPDYSDYFLNPEAYNDEDERESRVQALRDYPVKDFMTKHVETVLPQTPLMLAGGRMVAHRIHTLPVVNAEKELVGMISREMVFTTILKHKLSL
jgi:acetoin utilization protein AcuB